MPRASGGSFPLPLRYAAWALWVVILSTAALERAGADDFSDFRIPRHMLRSGALQLQGEAEHQKIQDTEHSDGQAEFSGTVSGTGSWVLDSDPLRLAFASAGDVYARRFHGHVNQFGPMVGGGYSTDETVQHQEDLEEGLSLSLGIRHYPWSVPVGWEVRIDGRTDYEQSWAHLDRTLILQDTTGSFASSATDGQSRRIVRSDVLSAVSLGWGRVRDASAVYDAHLLEQRLIRARTLSRPLSHEAMQRLIALLYAGGDYSVVHDRPTKYLWADIEGIMHADGALAGDHMDAYGVLRAMEPVIDLTSFSLTPFVRQRGMFVGATIRSDDAYVHGRIAYTSSIASSNQPPQSGSVEFRSRFSRDDVSWGPRAEFHVPLGLRWQLDADGTATVPVHPASPGSYQLDAGATARMLIADRWLWGATWRYTRERAVDRYSDDRFETELDYDLEDHLRIGLTYSELQARTERYFDTTRVDFGRHGAVSLGLTYRFLGALDIPGVTPPVRLAPVQ